MKKTIIPSLLCALILFGCNNSGTNIDEESRSREITTEATRLVYSKSVFDKYGDDEIRIENIIKQNKSKTNYFNQDSGWDSQSASSRYCPFCNHYDYHHTVRFLVRDGKPYKLIKCCSCGYIDLACNFKMIETLSGDK